MKRSRPYLIAKKSLFPVIWSIKTLVFLVFAALTVFMALKGDTISAIASMASTLTFVFGALAVVMLFIIIGIIVSVIAVAAVVFFVTKKK